MNYVDGAAALEYLRGVTESVPGLCLAAAWEAYHAEGAQSDVEYPTAASACAASAGMHAGDMNPPVGYPVWFGTRSDGEASGDVCISVGNGNVVGVWDLGVHEVSISERSGEINRPYLGWTDNFMTDNAIVPGIGRNITTRSTLDVQAAVGVPEADRDGIYGPQTTWYVVQAQRSHNLEPDGIYGPLTDGALFPGQSAPTVIAEGFDAAQPPAASAIVAAGRSFICRYVGALDNDPRQTSAEQIASYLNAGVSVVLNYEGSGTDATSFENGVADAQYAQARLAVLGFTDAVVYFSIDEAKAADPVAYFKGVESVLGHARTGAYGGLDTIQTLQAAGLCSYYWQTYAWSNGQWASGIHLAQYLNGQTVGGAQVDYDRALQPDFGQIHAPAVASVPTTPPPAPAAEALDVDGDLGPKTITRWQQVMGTTVDGSISDPSELVEAVQTALNNDGCRDYDGNVLDVDGEGIVQDGNRYKTVYALQVRLGTTRDGRLDPGDSEAIRALQVRLNAGTF